MLRMKSNFVKLFLKLNHVKYGKNLNLIGIPVIFREKGSEIIIGDGCLIKSDFLSNLVGLYQRTIIVARGEGNIHIGTNVGVSGATIYSRKKIIIGDHSNIGGNVKILDNDFHPVDPQARLNRDETRVKAKEVVIGRNVFIGCNAIILKGTILGDNCVVGAGSVVSGSFPAYSIVAGNPARIIKTIIPDEISSNINNESSISINNDSCTGSEKHVGLDCNSIDKE